MQYWSIRYFLIISLSAAILITSSLFIIRIAATHQQIRSLEAMAHDVASIAADNGGTLPKSPNMQNMLESMVRQHGLSGRPILYIVERDGAIRQQHPADPPDGTRQFGSMLPEMMTGSAHVLELETDASDFPYMVAVQPMVHESAITGYLLYFEKKHTRLKDLFSNSPKFIMLCMLLLIGWGIVYYMTRKLVKPIGDVARASKQVVAGSYDIYINTDYKEAEIYKLTHSFNEMTNRLARLEALRSQLLAGITKEMKTPVATIRNLVQAVKNNEVSGEEAEAYLEASLEESHRFKKMIEKLLEFNRYIAGGVSVSRESCDLDALLTEIIDRWKLSQNDKKLKVVQETANDRVDWQTSIDPACVEQVLINLLNNARDAMSSKGTVRVLLKHEPDNFLIQVQDTGRGIPQEKSDDMFELFYRGSDNRTHEHGLGIGLPFSRLIARSLGGDLVLSDGTPGKTTFTLILSSGHIQNTSI